jgi:hypothetical protein
MLRRYTNLRRSIHYIRGIGRAPEAQNWVAGLITLNESSRSIEQLKQLDISHEAKKKT